MKPILTLLAGALAAGFMAISPAAAQPYDNHRPPPQHYAPREQPPREQPRGEPNRGGGGPPTPPPVFIAHPPNSLGEGWRQQQDEVRQGVYQRRIMPLPTVLDELRRRAPGRQLDAGLETDASGRMIYRVRWMTLDGRRIDYMIDATTGQVLSGR